MAPGLCIDLLSCCMGVSATVRQEREKKKKEKKLCRLSPSCHVPATGLVATVFQNKRLSAGELPYSVRKPHKQANFYSISLVLAPPLKLSILLPANPGPVVLS